MFRSNATCLTTYVDYTGRTVFPMTVEFCPPDEGAAFNPEALAVKFHTILKKHYDDTLKMNVDEGTEECKNNNTTPNTIPDTNPDTIPDTTIPNQSDLQEFPTLSPNSNNDKDSFSSVVSRTQKENKPKPKYRVASSSNPIVTLQRSKPTVLSAWS